MQKVVTVLGHISPSSGEGSFTEREYPSLQKYLDEGYQVVNTILSQSTTSYAITFVLEKPN